MKEFYGIAEYLQASSELLLIKAERQLKRIKEVCDGNGTRRSSQCCCYDIPASKARP